MEVLQNLNQLGDLGILILRLAVAIIFLAHGLPKASMWKMTPSEQMPESMPAKMRALSIVEPLSGAAMLIGLYTQLAALALMIVMAGALYHKVVLWKKKFTEPGGWEFDFLLLAANFMLLFVGGEYFRWISRCWGSKSPCKN